MQSEQSGMQSESRQTIIHRPTTWCTPLAWRACINMREEEEKETEKGRASLAHCLTARHPEG